MARFGGPVVRAEEVTVPNQEELHQSPAGAYTRLQEAPAEAQVQYTYAPVWRIERPLFAGAVEVCIAWVIMLVETTIVTEEDGEAILAALRDMLKAGPDAFPFDPSRGDIYFNIQAELMASLGRDIGGQVYTGRSRVDGDPTKLRLFTRNQLMELADAISSLASACLELAAPHRDTVMPGYTGSQPAQPWTFGQYVLSYVDAVERDLQRVISAFERTNLSLMGLGTGSGTHLPVDRERVAELLGFDGIVENTREFVTSYDVFSEAISATSILLAHLGQLAQDLITWTTPEFGLVELQDSMAGSSSFMPQKKNATPLYKIRSVASASVGYMPAGLSVLKTSSQDFDYRAMIGPTVNSLRDAIDATRYMSAVVPALRINADLMRRRCVDHWTTATEIARLVQDRGDLNWRTAHWITERLVRAALESGIGPEQLRPEDVTRAAQDVIGRDVTVTQEELASAIDPGAFVRSRKTTGGPHPEEFDRMLADRVRVWEEWSARITSISERLAASREELLSIAFADG